MIPSSNPDLDLTISRVIKAPRPVIWKAWTDRASFEQWWIPAPAKCRVLEMDLRPGGSFVTQISENGGDFIPHLSGCFLAIDNLERIVFTNSLVSGWRSAEQPFMTAIITLKDHPMGTEYVAYVMHKNNAETGMKKWDFTTGGAPSPSNSPNSYNDSRNRQRAASAQNRFADDDHTQWPSRRSNGLDPRSQGRPVPGDRSNLRHVRHRFGRADHI